MQGESGEASEIRPGDRVFIRANPGRSGVVGNEEDGPAHRRRVLVHFSDGEEQFVLLASLEKAPDVAPGPYKLMLSGRYGKAADLRGAITYYRLSGKLANLIYSLNTTNTRFLAYQFKPVLHFLESPCRGILVADEVGLGKTVEAGLIWTELRAREDANKLLVVCPAMLQQKWQFELEDRFGVRAEIVGSGDLLARIKRARDQPERGFALIASLQGLRPKDGWDDEESPANGPSAELARYMDEFEGEDALIDLVVIDEAHYLRNRETQTHRLGQLLRPVAQNMVLLSATPIQLRSTDLFHLLNILDEDAFPYASSFDDTLAANAPVVELRDRVLASPLTQPEFVDALRDALLTRIFEDNAQIEHLIGNPPNEGELATEQGRSEIAERLDRINPLAKVVTRTRKRDVPEGHVTRNPVAIRATMSPAEEAFYSAVTERVRDYCEDLSISTGFMLTIPQRQLSSCMAAACQGWKRKLEEAEEELRETSEDSYGDTENTASRHPKLGSLLRELVAVAHEVGDFEALKSQDTKYGELSKSLLGYWKENPGRKVVLFSFYRHTLTYLRDRLAESGVRSVIVYGGMDKQDALRKFKDPAGPNILLASEVAAEGIDLQFSSLLINYDLPWNPMRIEQRIGRIDRIGQEADRILIWNFVYADTIDDRIYERLLERLDIFRQALGSVEAMLGEQIRELGYDLLRHQLTPKQEEERITRAQMAIANMNRQSEQLEEQATHLIAHGDYIQNKVRAARDLGRYISGDDLKVYVRDYFAREYSGTRFVVSEGDSSIVEFEMTAEAKAAFERFVDEARMRGRTALLSTNPPRLRFENRAGSAVRGTETVTQDHPLVRFVSEGLRNAGRGAGYFPVSAVEVPAAIAGDWPSGTYVYAVARWALSGSRDMERLEYAVVNLDTGATMRGDSAEQLVNRAAMQGRDWRAVANAVPNERAADAFDELKARLDDEFQRFRESYAREDEDRIKLMMNLLEHHREAQKAKIQERIDRYRYQGSDRQRRMIPVEEGRLKKQDARLRERIEALKLKSRLTTSESFVSAGVIRIA